MHPSLFARGRNRVDPLEAMRRLQAADPALGSVIDRVGAPTLKPRRMRSPFEALLSAIVYQQLSGAAAGTILGRVHALYDGGRCPTPEELLATDEARLRGAGLSRAKTAALLDLARHTLIGTVPDATTLRRLPDDDIVARLTAVRGIGRWTVEMLLIFRLGRPDVLPVDDLGVQKGLGRILGRRKVPAPRQLARYGERWKPYRSVASWYLWRAVELPD